MDYFEQIIARMLESRGWWVRQSVRIRLTKQEKRELGKHSLPRPEIDLVAFSPRANTLILFEVKPYLDSTGVKYVALADAKPGEGRYKILTDAKYQRMVARRLIARLIEDGLLVKKPKVLLGLDAGKVARKDRERVTELASKQNWMYLSPDDISNWVRPLAGQSYENDPVMLTAKLILRDSTDPNGNPLL